jgi:hypothetical protein
MKHRTKIKKSGAVLAFALTGLLLSASCGNKNPSLEAVIATEETEKMPEENLPPSDDMPKPPSSEMPGEGQQAQFNGEWDALVEFSEDEESDRESLSSIGTDENAIHCFNGAVVKLSDYTVERTSGDSTGGDIASFYGVGAAVLETDGECDIDASEITTDAAGGAGVFAYENGVVNIRNSEIKTEQNTSGGIHAAGGGTLHAWNLRVETNGTSSAAIRSDRGGGTMVIDGGTYTSNGAGSPAVYCTADIAIRNAELTSNYAEAVCVEGKNSLELFNVDLDGDMPSDEQNDTTWTVIVYQSMSGDSEIGNGAFRMVGGSLKSRNGGLFYTTNTQSTFYLKGVNITPSDDSDFFLRATGNKNARGWGEEGKNGAECSFTADSQIMQGDIIWDSISDLNMYMLSHSSLTGCIIKDDSCAGSGGNGYCNLYLDDDSVWTVTGDSTLTNLYMEGIDGQLVDADGNAVSVVGTDGTNYVRGDSEITVTVEGFSSSMDMSGAEKEPKFKNHAAEIPWEE